MKKRYVIFLINGKCSYFSFFCYREIQSKYVAVCEIICLKNFMNLSH